MESSKIKIGFILLLGCMILISCEVRNEICSIQERFDNGNTKVMVCIDKSRNIHNGFIFEKNSDTSFIYKFKEVNDTLVPMYYRNYEDGRVSEEIFFNPDDTTQEYEIEYTNDNQNRITYRVKGDAFYIRDDFKDSNISSYAFKYKTTYLDYSLKDDKIIEFEIQVPITDSLIHRHQPLFLSYGYTSDYIDTSNFRQEAIRIFNNLSDIDSLKITTNDVYRIRDTVNRTTNLTFVSALYSPNDSLIHNLSIRKLDY